MLPILVEPVFDAFGALTAQLFRLPLSRILVVEEEEVRYPVHHRMPGHDRQPRVEARCATASEKARAVVYHDLALETSAPGSRTRVVRLTPAPLLAGTGLGHFQKRRPWYC